MRDIFAKPVPVQHSEAFPDRIAYLLYPLLVVAYAALYAPWGINETDGGFLTGLAWQVLQGKALYTEVLYVRPPLPVWLRAAELQLLPEQWAVLGERWIFYAKIGIYVWLGASVLQQGRERLVLAFFGFVLCVHCYPPMTWHTIDGILFAVTALWCAQRAFEGPGRRFSAFASGLGIGAAILCKQSFYPLVLLIVLLPFPGRFARFLCAAGLSTVLLAFAGWLMATHASDRYVQLTFGAAESGQALQHGVLDYFRIQPLLLLATGGVAATLFWAERIAVGGWMRRLLPVAPQGASLLRCLAWRGWLLVLAATYGWAVLQRRDFTPPFSQIRLLFWVAVVVLFWEGVQAGFFTANRTLRHRLQRVFASEDAQAVQGRFFATSLLVSWCAAISWGYNFPILYAVPLVAAVMRVSQRCCGGQDQVGRASLLSLRPGRGWSAWRVFFLGGLLGLFYGAAQFVYRDGWKGNMDAHLGAVFPKLTGIYSDSTTLALYQDLKELAVRYGPVFATVPAFPQSNFLTNTRPPLPLDWKVRRETGGQEADLQRTLQETHPVLFIEKIYEPALAAGEPELLFLRKCLQEGQIVAETPHFIVVKMSP